MFIKIVTQGLPSKTTIEVVRLCNTIILEKGYGSYSMEDRKFKVILYLEEMVDEVNRILTLAEEYVIKFTRIPNKVEAEKIITTCQSVKENNPNSKPDFSIRNKVEEDCNEKNEVSTKLEDNGGQVIEKSLDSELLEDSQSTQPNERHETVDSMCENPNEDIHECNKKTVQEATYELFADVEGQKTSEELPSVVIEKLHLDAYFTTKSINLISQIIVAFANAEIKPKSFSKLQRLTGLNIYSQKVSKLNGIVDELFKRKFGVKTNSLEILKYACEKLSIKKEETSDESEPEEVIIEPLERPPNEGDTFQNTDVGNSAGLPDFLQNLDTNLSIRERIKQLVSYMGLKKLETTDQPIVDKVFFSIIFNKDTNLERLFNIDISLKRVSTAQGATRLLKKFIGEFYEMNVDEKFVNEFFKDLINNYPTTFEIKRKSPIQFQVTKKHSVEEEQENGELTCFPKNEEFDSYINNVKYGRGRKIQKILKIIKYMKYDEESKEDARIIYKTCTNLMLIENLYSLEKYVKKSNRDIIERFLNKFAKKLNTSAKTVKLKDFLHGLRTIINT